MSSVRVSYHTELKCLARENLLATEICSLIPRSNLWRWKQEPAHKYKTFDLNLKAVQDYELIRLFSQNKKAKRIFSAYVRLSKFFVEFTQGIPKFHKYVRDGKKLVVKTIGRVRDSLGLQNVLRVFGISVSTFRQWQLETYSSCFNSIVNKCNRIYPSQLSSFEIKSLREKLINPTYQFWPISSIAFESLRNGSLPLSLNTWYKYSKRLGIVRPKPFDRRKKRTEGIRAQKPNQVWHADITRFVTADNTVHYIYFVVDNFSRKILSWKVTNKVSALVRRETIGLALNELRNEDEHLVLITDGGPENSFKEYLENLEAKVTHQRALIDVQCSNSLIEAHFKVLKYNYLYKMSVADGGHLTKLVSWISRDFNARPHISLNGLTPNERYENMNLDFGSLDEMKKAASRERRFYNLKNRCALCQP